MRADDASAADIGRAVPIGDEPAAQITDDECLRRLTWALARHDPAQDDFGQLDEVARMIGRLAVAIE